MAGGEFEKLRKQLRLFDVYVISTGAMISAGFFLVPAVAAQHSGAGVVVAYALSGVFIVPALLSQAELATAMPRAGGPYFFLDRTLGPLVGTIGGVGTWLALVLKSAFALIGMGAYIGLVLEIPMTRIALALAVVLTVLNLVGAKQSSRLMRVLVITLLAILTLFIALGLGDLGFGSGVPNLRAQFSPMFPEGLDGLLGTVGLVFVSYIGLTKVASLAEEVEDPERNIPLGMMLGLGTVVTVYVIGVFIMVAYLGADGMVASYTPAAAAAEAFQTPLPSRVVVWLVVIAAIVAFASAANAGVLAASRYPLAMARDRILPDWLATAGGRGTPTKAVLLTSSLLILFLLVLDVEGVAKLASSLQLLLFALINVAVVVMRESGIQSYDPGFKSPFYPWLQLVGVFVPVVLVAEMGWLPVLATVGVTALCFGWYTYYAKPRIGRDGAIYHVFERLGRRRYAGLDRELRDLMKEKGLRAEDPFDEVVARATVLDFGTSVQLDSVIQEASSRLDRRLPVRSDELFDAFGRGVQMGGTPVSHGAALLHTRLPDLESSEMVLVRCHDGVRVPAEDVDLVRQAANQPIRAVFFLVSGEADPGQHLRVLAQLAGRVEDPDFMEQWLGSRHEQELKETLLRDDRFMSLKLQAAAPTESLIGHPIRDLSLPPGCLIALIRRYGEMIVPQGRTVLREGDRLTIIGAPAGLKELEHQFRPKLV
jgi:amino acid transporter/mannitol/fructose-specific phosphotransferase system IIA component (Ntr-type)